MVEEKIEKPTDEVFGETDIVDQLGMSARTFRYWRQEGYFSFLTKVTSGHTGRGPRVLAGVAQSLWAAEDLIEARVQASKVKSARRPRPGSQRRTFPILPIK